MFKHWKSRAVLTMAAALMMTTGTSANAQTTAQQNTRNQLYTSKTERMYNRAKEQKAQLDKKEKKELYKEGEVIVLYGDNTKNVKAFTNNDLGKDIEVVETYTFETPADNKANAKATGANSKGSMHFSLVKSSKYTTKQLMEMMKKRSDVKSVSPNFRVKAQAADLSDMQWANKAPGENGGGINAPAINAAIKENKSAGKDDGKEKVIAIVDTGVDYTHPDLADKMWENPYDDIKGEYGFDVVNGDDDPMDDFGHGTHCAGIAAGNYDGQGISGVVDSDNIKVMALKMLDENGESYFMEEVECYNYIYRTQLKGTNVVAINNSWGIDVYPEEEEFLTEEDWAYLNSADSIFAALADLTGQQGAITCVAAGNESLDNDWHICYPSNVDSDYVVTVAASDQNDELTWFSNYGQEGVDLAAPGEGIISSVCYDVFEPSILDDESAKEVSAYFNNFDNMTDEDLATTPSEDSISFDWSQAKVIGVGNEEESGVSITADEKYGSEGQSAKIHLSGLKKNKEYYVSVPFKAPSKSFYYSYKENLDSENVQDLFEADVVWGSIESAEFDDTLKPENATWGYGANMGWMAENGMFEADEAGQDLRFVFTVASIGKSDMDLYIDDIAISKSTEEEFGKYDIYDGTSMATPAVTGAAAALADLYPELSALERKNLLLSCTREGKESVQQGTRTGGILDLTNVKNPNAYVRSAEFVDEKNVVINGSNLDGATVKFNDEEVTPVEQTDSSIVVDAKDYLNKEVIVEVTKNNRSVARYMLLVTGKELELVSDVSEGLDEYDCMLIADPFNQTISNGNNIYVVGSSGIVYKTDDKQKKTTRLNDGFTVDIFGEGFESYEIAGNGAVLDNNCVSLNGDIYAVASLNSMFEHQKALVRFTEANGWERVADIPEELNEVDGTILGAYNGTIYAFGGVDTENEDVLTDMYSLDMKTGKWSEEAELPSGRAFSKTVQSGDQMLVSFGVKDFEGGCPEVLMFDGKKWTESKQEIDAFSTVGIIYGMKDSEEFAPEDGEEFEEGVGVGRLRNKVELYNKAQHEDGGMSFEDFLASLKVLNIYTGDLAATKNGAILHGMLVYGQGDIVSYDMKKDEIKATGYKNKDDFYTGATVLNDKLQVVATDFDEVVEIYSMPIESGMVKLQVTGAEFADITKAQSEWYPSDNVSFSITAKKGCQITSVKIAGQEVKADEKGVYSYNAPASATVDGVKVEIKGTKTDDKKTDNQKTTETKAPTTETKAPTTETKAPTTETKALATTETKTPATTEAKKELPKKNSNHKVQGLTYKVTKADEKNGTVSCVGVANKKSKTVDVPATVEINGYTFKVTKIGNNAFASAKNLKSITIGENVTSIGKNVAKSCKKLTKVTIKSTKIKSIGKGSFKSINKKAVIKTPKKMKKEYAKKLKKAGCKAKVK